jgi:sterol desaturase/sphingolipid hydroxylase (fatty acid hydroxylase superfamily)
MSEWLLAALRASGLAVTQALIALAIPALAFFILAMILRRGTFWSDIRRVLPETKLNLLLAGANAAVMTPILAFLSTVTTDALHDNGLTLIDAQVWERLPLPALVLIGVVAGDFIAYWRHRLEHCAFLWPSHAIHHSDRQMTWVTIERFHPINRVTTFFIDTVALSLLGLPPAAIVANNFVRHYYGLYVHSDLDWTYGRLGRIFVSPAMHRWHHAMDKAAMNTNFATVFSLFDDLFGTFYLPGPCKSPLGVGDEIGEGLANTLAYPFRKRAYRSVLPGPEPLAARQT